MGYWKCKKCGGKIRVVFSRVVNTDYNIDKNGNPIGKCLRKLEGEIEAENFFCKKCGQYLDSYGTSLKQIAEWMEE